MSLLSVACACGAMQAVNIILIYCCRYLGQLLYFKCCDYARGCRILSQDHERKSMANNVERRRWSLWRVGGRGIVPPRAPDATSPRQCPTKNALMAPSARSNKACLNEVSQPHRSLRGFRLDTASAPSLKWSV